tara:strand:+ start:316 stop:786 length:471 start_codon:yes stop_codon:yes gene_type:complete
MNLTKLFKNFNKHLYSLNDSKFFAGIIFIMLNIGSKYITLKFSKSQEAYLRLVLSRQLLIFSIAWMGTRDIYMAFIILAIFVVLADFLLNEESSFCILPESYKTFYKLMDTNNDGVLTEDEINQSIRILEKAKKLKNKEVQNEAYDKFHNLKNKDY